MNLCVNQLIGFGVGDSGIGGNDANTQLLIHCDGADASTTFTDVSQNAHTVTANGNAQVDTSQSVFGGGSFLTDGAGDYLGIADDASLRPGSGDFTLDFQNRFAAGSKTQTIFQKGFVGAGDLLLQTTTAASPVINVFIGGSIVINSGALSINTWYHLGIIRDSGTITFYVDGVDVSNASNSTNINSTAEMTFGGGTQASLDGWMDEIRYSDVARDPADWPPTQAYS